MAKKSQYQPGRNLPSKSSVGIGRPLRNPPLNVRSLEEMYRHPQPAAGKRQGKPKTPTFKKP
jgi:hypothetical protein